MTAVVLAGGRGRRLQTSDHSGLATDAQRRAAVAGLKVLMPVGPQGRPFIDIVLARLVAAGCTDVALVVPPHHNELADHLAAHAEPGLRIRLAVQASATGTAGAVLAAAASVHARRFLVVNGDNLYPVDVMRTLAALDDCAVAGFTLVSLERESGFASRRVAAFATIEHDAEGWLTGMREKPGVAALARGGEDALVSVNLWRMDQTIFDACRDVPLSPRGERELPDAVMLGVARGTRFRVVPSRGTVFDLTSADDVSAVSRGLSAAEMQP